MSPDGLRLVSRGWDAATHKDGSHSVRKIEWEVETGRIQSNEKFEEQPDLTSASSPDGRLVVSSEGSISSVCQIGDDAAHEHQLTGHADVVTSVALVAIRVPLRGS